MTKYNALYLYAFLIIISGGVIVLLVEGPFELLKETFFITILLSAIFAGFTAFKCAPNQVPLNYHALHALGLFLYGLSFMMLAKDLSNLFQISIFYLLYYGLAELIFGLQMLLQKDKMLFRIIAIRLSIGFFIALSAVGLFISIDKYINLTQAFKVIGVLFMLSGVNLFFFKDVLKKLYQKENILTNADAIV
jgi:hypothetical protein